MRVLITTPASLGHLQPMVPLARVMADRGHDVLWMLPANGVAEVERRGLRAAAASAELQIGPAVAMQRYPELRGLSPEDVPKVMFGKLWGAMAAPPMLAGLAPRALSWRPDLVVSDAAELAGHIVAAELGVPAVTKGFGPLLPAARVAAAADEVAPLWRSRGLEPRPYAGCYDTLYLDPYPPVLQLEDATGHIQRRRHVRPGGDFGGLDASPVPLVPPDPVDGPLVYVTMGTVFNDPGPLHLILEALGTLDVRAIVTVGPRGEPAVLGPQSERVRIERYVPQNALLPHCDAVISHGGSGTAVGALEAAIPQLCLPQGADQFLNAAAIAGAGAGLALLPGEATADAIAQALGRLLADRTFREEAGRVSRDIASMPSVEEAAATLESLAGGRSS